MVGHVTPEAFDGGPIGLIQDGDELTIDAEKKEINLNIPETEFTHRAKAWSAPEPYADRGTLAKYARLVSSASEGAVTDKYL